MRFLSMLILWACLALPAPAQLVDTPHKGGAILGPSRGDYPYVAQLTPFAAECNYMSREGYLRYLVYANTHWWLTSAEAAQVVHDEIEAAGR